MIRVATLGEALGMFRTTGVESLAHAATATVATGGAEANVAIGLSRLGTAVSWLGRVGDDAIGRRIVRELRAEGVDALAIVDAAAPTGIMLKERPRPGRTAVQFYRDASAGSRLDPADLDALDIPSARLLHVTGILPALSAAAHRTSTTAVELANVSGVPVSFDVNHRSRLWDATTAIPVYRRLAEHARIVFGGRDELELLVGSHASDEELAQAVSQLGPVEVVVKLGEGGCGVWGDGSWLRVPAVEVDVVDTVGAGDAFVAGYLYERLHGGSVAQAAETATRTGAAVCGFEGDWEGALTLRELRSTAAGDPVER